MTFSEAVRGFASYKSMTKEAISSGKFKPTHRVRHVQSTTARFRQDSRRWFHLLVLPGFFIPTSACSYNVRLPIDSCGMIAVPHPDARWPVPVTLKALWRRQTAYFTAYEEHESCQ